MEIDNFALDIDEIIKEYPDNPLEFFQEKRLCLFKACLEKYFPGVRWGIYDLLEDLDLNVSVCNKQSCCSGTFFQRNLITRAQFAAINERNLNEINRQADILLVSCNGCYNSLLRGRDFLREKEVYRKTQEILNGLKEEFDEDYEKKYEILENPALRIVHDLDFLYLIRNQVLSTLKFDLKGLKVASHYGCHYLNLDRDKKNMTSYLGDKHKLEDFVTLFGGEAVDYKEYEGCCGWGASQIVLHSEDALKVTFKKLESATNAGADFLLMPCPTCLYTLSKPKFRDDMEDLFNKRLDIPTIHINELISILRGCEEERCISMRKNSPRIHEIYEIITEK
ncbi:MAG: heterodisulfide reductase-related iron-sulfur binding cluster [Promethearchaeia archaeon]